MSGYCSSRWQCLRQAGHAGPCAHEPAGYEPAGFCYGPCGCGHPADEHPSGPCLWGARSYAGSEAETCPCREYRPARRWVIWSNEHGGGWWRPDRAGYTNDLGKAGRFTEGDARRCIGAEPGAFLGYHHRTDCEHPYHKVGRRRVLRDRMIPAEIMMPDPLAEVEHD